jgi:CDGSH-type Zn-finger protein
MSKRPKITPTENGPYKLEDCEQITRMTDGRVFEIDGTAYLCRCGGSKNKPFCDGTHKTNGFTGAKEPDRVPDKRENYEGDGITIHDNRGLCAHAGRCTDNLKTVFKLGTEPWIDPRGASADEIARVISMCPSGALSYSIEGVEHSERGGDPQVILAPHGPYVFIGGADVEGVKLMKGGTLDHFDLCRCGKSKNKPFCSGAHWFVDFDQDAPPREDT